MKTSELRIGNLVNYGNAVKQLDAELFLQLLKYTTPFEPIHLTEQWLLKFGFKEFKGYFALDTEEFSLKFTHKNTDKVILLEISGQDDYGFHQYTCTPLINIKYLHQLQNLYFALTGEELTFKSE